MTIYGPLFGQTFVRAIREDRKDPELLKKAPPKKELQKSFLGSCLAACIRSAIHLEILRAGSHFSFFHGWPTGEDLFGVTVTTFAVWLGYVVPPQLSAVLWERRDPVIPALAAGENLTALTVTAWVFWAIGAI
ncbi:hypothetical protein HDV00_003309 [Rhizophlyctis rosea]|nr:hypothetical protein HDV00_003309 [Rhizophlyctis rosea]